MADRYRVQVYSSTDEGVVDFTLTELKPLPERFGGQQIRPLQGAAATISWSVQVVDVNNVLSIHLDEHLLGRKLQAQRSISGSTTWETLGTGRISHIRQTGAAKFLLSVSDERMVERSTMVFTGNAATTKIWPLDLIEPYREWTPYGYDYRGYDFSTAGPLGGPVWWNRVDRVGGTITVMEANHTAVLPTAVRELFDSDRTAGDVAVGFGYAAGGNYRSIRFRLTARPGDTYTGQDFEVVGFSASKLGIGIVDAGARIIWATPSEKITHVYLYDKGNVIPNDGRFRDGYFYQPQSPASELVPVHIGGSSGIDPMQLAMNIYDGQYQQNKVLVQGGWLGLDTSIPVQTVGYSTSVFSTYSSTNPTGVLGRFGRGWWRVTNAANMATWLEENVYKPTGTVPVVDGSGKIAPAVVAPPTAVEIPDINDLFTFDKSNSVLLPSWEQTAREQVNRITYRWLNEQRTEGVDPNSGELLEGVGCDRLLAVEGKPVTIHASTEPEVRRDFEVWTRGLHHRDEVIGWSKEHGRGILDRHWRGPQYSTLRAKLPAVYVDLPGASGDYISTPDSAALSVTGDIDIRSKVAMDDWTPAAIQTFSAKYDAANEHSWIFWVNTSGHLGFIWSEDGFTDTGSETSGAATGFTNGSVGWVRVTLDVDNGSSDAEVKFYTSTDGVSWNQLGSTQLHGSTTSIFDGTDPVEIGSYHVGVNSRLVGNVYTCQIRDGINGTVVADVDFSDRDSWNNTLGIFHGAAGNKWTLQGNAAVVNGGRVSPGSMVVVDLASYPNTASGGRGGDVVAVVLSEAVTPTGSVYTIQHAGEKLQPLSAPTVALAQNANNTRHWMDLSITNMPSTSDNFVAQLARAASSSGPMEREWRTVEVGVGNGSRTITALRNNTKYYARAHAWREGRIRSAWSVVDSTATTAIPAPTGLAVSNIKRRQATATWTAGDADEKVLLYIDGTKVYNISAGSVSKVMHQLTPSTTYGVTVRHADRYSGLGLSSTAVSFTTGSSTGPSHLSKPEAIVILRGVDSTKLRSS